MKARFRIRTRDGEEIEPKSVEIFAELVRSGVIRPEDLVYDSLTGEWSPAETHPMVQLFLDPLTDPSSEALAARMAVEADEVADEATEEESPAEAPSRDEAEAAESPEAQAPTASEAEEAGTASAGDAELTLDLVDQPEVSPEEEARAFIEKMEEERRSDSGGLESGEVSLVDSRSGVVEGLAPPKKDWISAPAAPEKAYADEPSEAEWEPPPASAPPKRRRSLTSWGLILAGVALPVLALSLYAASRRGSSATREDSTAAAAPTRPPRRVPQTEEQIREEAFVGFLQRMDSLRQDNQVGDVPKAWLEGYYLADPTAYPEVREFWQRYLVYAEAAQADEARLYREAYLDAATVAGLSGPVRSLRLASALEDFSSRWSEREAHYSRVRELAEAALALDDLMKQLHGRITYEPIRGQKVSADPVIEAAGSDAEAQAELEAALDRVLTALHDAGGSTALNRDAVPGWVVDGLAKMEESRIGTPLPPPQPRPQPQ